MPEYRRRGGFDVVRDKEIAALHRRERAGHGEEGDGGARACAEGNRGPIARAANDVDEVGAQSGFDAKRIHFFARGVEHAGGDGLKRDLIEVARIESLFATQEQFGFFGSARISDANLQRGSDRVALRAADTCPRIRLDFAWRER